MNLKPFGSRLIPFALLLSSFTFQANAQTLQPHRITAWENAGLTLPVTAPENEVSIMDFGADNTGTVSSNAAYTAAIASLNGNAGTIVFPEGDYRFTSTLSVPDSVFLKGASSETTLNFNLGGTGDLIVLNGSMAATQYALASGGVKGTHTLQLADASALQVGDIIRLHQFDEDLMFSSWAYGTLGQVVEITAINDNTIDLADPLNHHYPLSRNPYMRKLNPIRAAGLECLSIVREDATVGQTSNIKVNYGFNCAIRNVASENCNFAHLELNSCAHMEIRGCYFHHAHAYGGGGQGYGLVYQVASSFNLAENNVFNHLRHSMLIQSGANGNVLGYNYSYDPFWTEGGFFPANSAGDVVLHGNYTYMNLIEGNTVQHIVIDASHGKNGPYNTFLRNRAELYGFFSDGNTTSDSMNVVGNELTLSAFPYGMYNLQGLGHYSFGNSRAGTVEPVGTSNITLTTLYLNGSQLPSFLSGNSLPMIGLPLTLAQKTIPAESRYDTGEPVSCAAEVITAIAQPEVEAQPSVKLVGNTLWVDPALLPATVSVYAVDGRLMQQFRTSVAITELSALPAHAIHLFRVQGNDGGIRTAKGIIGGGFRF